MTKEKNIIVGTRASLLAMTQTKQTCEIIFNQGFNYVLKKIITSGDIEQNKTFSEFGRQAIFSKELDEALLNHECDIAIHSFKDLTGEIPKGLKLQMLCNQVDAHDCFVSNKYKKINDLPAGAVIGTSSVRRFSILKKHYPHLVIKPIRGNVDTRIMKMQKGDYDAILLAKAGLIRLNKKNMIASDLDKKIFTPPLGQGLIAVVTRDEKNIFEYLNKNKIIDYFDVILCLKKIISSYEGGCSLPFGLEIQSVNEKLCFNVYLGNAVDNTEVRFSMYHHGESLDILEDRFRTMMEKNNAQSICNSMKNFKISYE
ncbi:MAG TPA: hydroxymethylbilane synthase [Oligoflexia bacterium]|nr:hydroxymethylbilane synthase [Oligoflexia bacterium]HMR24802.1 hydroxymethylbilane synthase [Oligoflexia bacterium]